MHSIISENNVQNVLFDFFTLIFMKSHEKKGHACHNQYK